MPPHTKAKLRPSHQGKGGANARLNLFPGGLFPNPCFFFGPPHKEKSPNHCPLSGINGSQSFRIPPGRLLFQAKIR